jgi:hypothetical protein
MEWAMRRIVDLMGVSTMCFLDDRGAADTVWGAGHGEDKSSQPT